MTQVQVFKKGDKVKIIEGGWGIHPRHIGKIVTIHSVIESADGKTRYTTEESFTEGLSTHRGRHTSARGESFELVSPAVKPEDAIRVLNVQLEELDAQRAVLMAERRTLVAALLEDLKVSV